VSPKDEADKALRAEDLEQQAPDRWKPAVAALKRFLLEECHPDAGAKEGVTVYVFGDVVPWPGKDDRCLCRIVEVDFNTDRGGSAIQVEAATLGLLAACAQFVETYLVEPFTPEGWTTAIDVREDARLRLKKLLHLPSQEFMLKTLRQIRQLSKESPGMSLILALRQNHAGSAMTPISAVVDGYLEMASDVG
jgi:hypothetical protein